MKGQRRFKFTARLPRTSATYHGKAEVDEHREQ
jgi:hypothetical protein